MKTQKTFFTLGVLLLLFSVSCGYRREYTFGVCEDRSVDVRYISGVSSLSLVDGSNNAVSVVNDQVHIENFYQYPAATDLSIMLKFVGKRGLIPSALISIVIRKLKIA